MNDIEINDIEIRDEMISQMIMFNSLLESKNKNQQAYENLIFKNMNLSQDRNLDQQSKNYIEKKIQKLKEHKNTNRSQQIKKLVLVNEKIKSGIDKLRINNRTDEFIELVENFYDNGYKILMSSDDKTEKINFEKGIVMLLHDDTEESDIMVNEFRKLKQNTDGHVNIISLNCSKNKYNEISNLCAEMKDINDVLNIEKPNYPTVVLLKDRENINSDNGVTIYNGNISGEGLLKLMENLQKP
jgi:hypothetical protein